MFFYILIWFVCVCLGIALLIMPCLTTTCRNNSLRSSTLKQKLFLTVIFSNEIGARIITPDSGPILSIF